jgi:nucleoside-diphosphate-sugar epimerase
VLILDANATGAYDIGRDDDQRMLHDIAQLSCRLAGAPEELIEVVDPPVGPAPVLEHLDLAGLRGLGWRPEVELEDGMARTLEWLSSPA